jgi:dTDP-4-amino-4,6-dideoxygalactose transaminase
MLRVESGGTVLMPSYHHGVEVAAVRAAGFDVDFYRIDEEMRADAEDLFKRISPRTRVIYLTQFFGVPQPIEEIRLAADAVGVPLIEDCAMAMFGDDRGQPIGSRGDLAIFCLYKTLPVPDGGFLVVNRPDLPLPDEPVAPRSFSPVIQLTRLFFNRVAMHHGWLGRRVRALGYGLGHHGVAALSLPRAPVGTTVFNPRLVDWGASWVTSSALKRVDVHAVASSRWRNFCALADALAPVVRLPIRRLPEGACPVYFPIRVRNKPRFRAALEARGIESVDFWSGGLEPPGVFAEVERLRREVVCVPVHQDLEARHVDRLIRAVKQAAS